MRMQVLAACTPAWAAVVAQSDQLIEGPGFRQLKRSKRTIAGLIVVNGAVAFVKRVDEGSGVKGWIKRINGSRARRVLRGAAILKAAGFARPEPLAAAEARALGAVRASYVISEALEGARIMSDVLLAGGRCNFRHRCAVSGVIAAEIRRLHDAGIYTLDLQETNLMLSAEWKIHFVDLEDFRTTRTVSQRRRMLNLVHLDRTIGRFVPRTLRLRFFYNYLARRPGPDEARRLLTQFFKLRALAARRAHAKHRTLPAAQSKPPDETTRPALSPAMRN
jgi:hypothetical protein